VLMYAPWPAVLTESFGTAERYTGASLGYQLASLLGGGFAPLIGGGLLAAGRGHSGYVALFVAASAAATAVAACLIGETSNADLAAPATPETADAATTT